MTRRADTEAVDLRTRAESLLDSAPVRRPDPERLEPDILVYELSVFEVELEMQNEELRRAQTELEEARDRYHALYDSAPVGYVSLDLGGRMNEANHRAHALLGVPREAEALVGRALASFMEVPSADALHVHLQRAADHGERTICELEVLRADEDEPAPVAVRLHATAATSPAGELTGWRCVLVDLSEVRAAEARKQAVLDTAVEGIVVCDQAGRIESINPVAQRLFGYRAADAIGRDVDELLPVRTQGAPSEGEPSSRETKGQRRDGTSFPCEIGIGHFEEAGERKFVAAIRDLTARNQAAREKEEREALLRQIAEYVDDAFVIRSRRTGRLLYSSPAFARVWGRSSAEALERGSFPLDWVDPRDRDEVARACEAIATGRPLDLEFRVPRPDGELSYLRARSYPILEADGQVLRDAAVLRDVTRERRLEENLRQAQKMEAVGALASGVAHDFNNVLQGILGCLRIARDPGTPMEQARELLDHAAKAAQRGGELAARLNEFSRKRDSEPGAVALDAIVRSLAPLLEQLLTEPIALELELGAPDAVVHADPVQLEQILMNLVGNARDATQPGGRVDIETRLVSSDEAPAGSPDRWVTLTVRDDGHGMDEATQARIFDPFFTTKELGEGTGLGLATVFAICKAMGGTIRVDSAPGAGSAFTLVLPLTQLPARTEEVLRERSLRFSGRALVVEDDRLVRLSVGAHLEALGFDVMEAETAEDAEALLELGAQVDLLVADVVLPGMRGTTLASRLVERLPDLPVVFTTANPELVDEESVGWPVLRKPFGREALAEAIADLLATTVAPARVLVVEPEPASRLALVAMLEEQGHQVAEADRPSRALALASGEGVAFDLLLTDVKLPEMPGDALADRLRESQPGLRVVYVTGRGGVPAGGDGLVTKPIEFDALREVVEAALSDQSAPSG